MSGYDREQPESKFGLIFSLMFILGTKYINNHGIVYLVHFSLLLHFFMCPVNPFSGTLNPTGKFYFH